MVIYKQPKTGTFKVEGIEKDKTGGIIQKEETVDVVGETADLFITRFIETSVADWNDDGMFYAAYTMPIGVHKTRFIKWEFTQLKLF